MAEKRALEKILKPKAKERQREGGKNKGSPNLGKALDTEKQTATAIGISHGTLAKLEVIEAEKPELLDKIDAGTRTVHSAYSQIQIEKQREERKRNVATSLDIGGKQS